MKMSPINNSFKVLPIAHALAIALVFAPIALSGDTLTGKVSAVTNDAVVIIVDGDLLPAVGDKADVFFKIPGSDVEVSVGSGNVTGVEPAVVRVGIDHATGKVERNQLVRITSPHPQKRSEIAARASAPQVTATTSPGPVVERTYPPSSPYAATAGHNPIIAFVDMDQVFRAYNKTKDSEAGITDEKNAAKKEYDTRAEAYKKALDEIETLNRQLGSTARTADGNSELVRNRDAKVASIKKMERELNEFRSTRERELQTKASRIRNAIVAEINQRTGTLVNGADNLILDRSGTSVDGVPIILCSPSNADLSSQVVAALNENRSSPVQPAQPAPVGTVNVDRIFTEFGRSKEAKAKIEQAKAAAKTEYESRADAYKRALDAVNALDKQLDSGTVDEQSKSGMIRDRDAKVAELQKMKREVDDFRVAKEKELQNQALQLRAGLVAEIRKAVQAGATGAVIIDVSGNSENGAPIVLYSKGLTDLSKEVISFLNSKSSSLPFHSPLPASSFRVGLVDMNRVFNQSPDGKLALAKRDDALAAGKKDYNARLDTYKMRLEEVEGLNKQLSSGKLDPQAQSRLTHDRNVKVANLKKMEQELNDFRATTEKQMQNEAVRMRQMVVAKIRNAVNRCAASEGFNLVFDSSGSSQNHTRVVVLAHDVPDLTDKVLTLIGR